MCPAAAATPDATVLRWATNVGEELLHERLGLAGLMRHELPPALLANLQESINRHLLDLGNHQSSAQRNDQV